MNRGGASDSQGEPVAASIRPNQGQQYQDSLHTSLGDSVREYMAAAQSQSTQRSYALDIKHFTANGGTIPASPAIVAHYLAKFAGTQAIATLEHRLIAIQRAHKEAGYDSPIADQLVKRTMQGIRRTYGVAQRRVRAIVKDDLLEMLVLVNKQQPMKAARDRALLLLGFAGALRRSELVAVRCEDLTHYDTGVEILLRRSKTDQEGEGRTVWVPFAKAEDRCPVLALKLWQALAGIDQGYVFRSVNRHGHVVGTRALTPQSVALVVKAATKRVRGVDAARGVSAHSLRAGYCTEAAVVGLQPWQIREQTGHKSDATLARYIRPVNKRKIPSLL